MTVNDHSFFFFFFQAEDGIRDRNVTGVQTCALPISYTWRLPTRNGKQSFPSLWLSAPPSAHSMANPIAMYKGVPLRSEERRVGKECRSRRATCNEKNKRIVNYANHSEDIQDNMILME